MATSIRSFQRALFSRQSAVRNFSRFHGQVKPFQHVFRRGYADPAGASTTASHSHTTPPPPPPPSGGGGSGNTILAILGAAVAAGGIGWYVMSDGQQKTKTFAPGFEDYQKVYNAVAKRFADMTDYDDGSYAPVVLRLAWHASGTYDKDTNTGGSNGATMRFDPESDHGANAGLKTARDFLEPVKTQFPWISHSDLWTLAGVAAVQEMQGPIVPWRPGRQDRDVAFCTPDGRLPDAAQGAKHVRDIFYRMGLNDQEIVALLGAHSLGRCHPDRSGFDGPWTFSPTTVTNDYYQLLLNEKWQWKKGSGPAQYEDKKTKSLMMLPADMAFVLDPKFKTFVKEYAQDNDKFFNDFSNVLVKLFELGVPFTTSEEERFRFKPLE